MKKLLHARRGYAFDLRLNARLRRYSTAAPQPLRVLFCGSDEFSASILQRLHEESTADKRLIKSINVVCRAGKPAGRGQKNIVSSPVKLLSQKLGLDLSEIPTFTGWEPPTHKTEGGLIVAVSFGLKVPRRVLQGAEFGGINLHPSLLPDLRGPAPLQRTILRGDEKSGVTIQTLHPERFDHGRILAQSSFSIPHKGRCSYEKLSQIAAASGAQLLVDVLRAMVAGELMGNVENEQDETMQGLDHAPKVEPVENRIEWKQWDTPRILRSQRALGTLWSMHKVTKGKQEETVRVQWHDLEPICLKLGEAEIAKVRELRSQGQPLMLKLARKGGSERLASTMDGSVTIDVKVADLDASSKFEILALDDWEGWPKQQIAIECADGGFISPRSVTVEGRKKKQDPGILLPQLMIRN